MTKIDRILSVYLETVIPEGEVGVRIWNRTCEESAAEYGKKSCKIQKLQG